MKIEALAKQFTFLSSRMLDKSVLILISGKANSGKTTFANIIQSELEKEYDISIKSYASKIKECATEFYYWDGLKDPKGRKLLQDLGKIGREYNEDLWVSGLLFDIEDEIYIKDIYIVDDWRFPNEKKYLEKHNMFYIFTVRMERDGLANDSDVSENALPPGQLDNISTYYDMVVDNNYKIEDLKEYVETIKIYLEKLEDNDG